MIAALLLAQASEPLVLPATTAYLVPHGSRRGRADLEITGTNVQVMWGGRIEASGNLIVSAQADGAGDKAGLKLTVKGPNYEVTLPGMGGFISVKPGWHTFTVRATGEAPFGRVTGLSLSGPAAVGAKFNLKPRLNSASVHIGYPVPQGVEAAWMLNEVRAVTDPIHSFYMACGFRRGYFGMQVNSTTERRIIFSVWDAGGEPNDRGLVPAENRVKLLAKGPDVYAGDFGNEGTGGHSHLKVNWATGVRQRFLLGAQKDGDGTIYTGFWWDPAKSDWRLIASFRAPKDGQLLRGLHSFIENFWGDTGYLLRQAEFGPVWIRTPEGAWRNLATARFTHDSTGGGDRWDYDLAAKGTGWLLQNGGFVGSSPKHGSMMETRPATAPPVIDFSRLPK